jgi:hypothetical protein
MHPPPQRILEATGHSVFAVTYLECFFVPLQGITNTLIYLFTSQAHKVPPVISIYCPHDWPTLSLRRTSIVAYEDSPTWPQKEVRASTPLPSSVLSLVWLW